MQSSYWIAVKKAGSEQLDKTAILISKNKTQNIYIVTKLFVPSEVEAPCSCSISQTPGGFSKARCAGAVCGEIPLPSHRACDFV